MEVLVKCPNPRCTKKRLRACPADLQQVVRCLHCQATFTLSPRHLLRDGPTWPVRLRRGAGAALAALLPAGLGQWFRPEPLPAPDTGPGDADLVSLADHGIHLTPDPGPRPTRRRSTVSHAAQTTDGGEPPAPPPSGLPRQIGRFLVRGRLGGGNFGTVYQAYDPQLDREVALKVPRGGVLETPERIQRFLGDARSAARLRHPNIVPVYDAGQDGPLFYIASALVRGRTLAEAGREGALDFRRSAAVVRDLAEALAYAHGLGIIHRDIKPANILLDEQGRPHLIDFGLAYRQDSAGQSAEPRPDSEPEDGARLTQDGFIVGTPAYMAPEHARGRRGDVEAPSDQYSLGVVLYELLCGHVPFEGPVQVILFNHLRTPPEPPREVNPAVPRDLEAICLKAMAKRPADRYPTCREMADDLRRFLEHEPVRARRMGPVERTRRWCRREPALAGALLAIGVLSLLFGVIMWRVAAHARHEEGRARGEEIRAGENADRAAKNEREARSNLAGSRLDRALDLCKQGEVGQGLVRMSEALKLADEARDEDLRRVIEWNLAGWRRRLPSLKHVLTEQGPVRALALGPRGELLVTGGAGPRGNGAQVWEVRTGQRRALLPHDRAVLAVGFSPDGSKVVTGSADGSARVWDLRAVKVLVECKHPHAVHAVAWSPDGRLLLTGSGTADGAAGEARLWDAADGTLRGEPMRHTGPVYAVAFSRDGTQFATGGGTTFRGEARVWNAATGEPIPYDTPLRHAGAVNALAFSPDGTLLLTGSGSLFKGQAQLWDVATGKPHGKALSDGLEIYAVAFSPDGKTVAAAGQDRTARLWDAETGQPVGSPLWHTKDVVAVAFSPDGRAVVTGGDDRTVRLWEAVAHRPYAARFDHGGAILAAAVAPDGKTFLTGSVTPLGTGEARLYPLGPGKRLERIAHGRPVSAVAFSRDGSRLATGTWGGEVRLWDPRHFRDGKGGPRPLLGGKLPGGERVQALAFRPDGRAVLVGGWQGALLLWDLDGGAMRPVPGEHGRIFAVAFSPDGKTFLTGSRDETARLWDAETLQQLHTFRHPDAVLSVAFSPDGRRILTGYAGATLLWDARTRERLGLPFLHQAGVFGAAFGPGGRTIVTGGTDKAARVWDVATHKPIGPPLAHEGAVLAAAFAPDGRTVLTAGLDRTARLWNVWEPMTEEAERTRLWAEVVTGIELDGRGVIHVLDGAGWDRRRGELAGQGGPPAVERAVAEELKGQPDVEAPESVPNPRLARRPPPPPPPPPRPAPEPERVREERVRPENLIDPGAEILLSLDVRQLMKLPGVKKYAAKELKKVLGKNEGLRALLNVAVRKPLDDIASVLLVSSGGVDRTLAIVRGEFDYPGMRAAAEKFARGQPGGLKMSLQEGVPFWEVEDGGRPLFAALAGPSTLVLAPSREYLVWELRAARRPRAPLGGRMRAALADRAGGEAVWLAVAVTEEMKGRLGEGNPALQEFAARVQSMSAGVTQVKDLVRLDVRLHTAGLRATYQVEEYIDNVKSTLGDLLMGNGDAGRALNDLLGKIEVWKDRTTHTVKLSLKLPPDALGALLAAPR